MLPRRHLCAGEKRGPAVGTTRKGKGTKLMVLVERAGLPLGVCLDAATVAEVSLAEATLATVAVPRGGPGHPKVKPVRIIADRGYESRALWQRLRRRGIDLIVPHRRQIIHRFQDGRKLRRYRRRYIVERTISWLLSFRRLLVRHEHRIELYRAFVHVACLWIVLRRL
ncbi:MAG TPA: IS5 family transposase [Gemmatimonadales bacterium]|nr:IS5 family transposase [Gemmatimonadales bacterium]